MLHRSVIAATTVTPAATSSTTVSAMRTFARACYTTRPVPSILSTSSFRTHRRTIQRTSVQRTQSRFFHSATLQRSNTQTPQATTDATVTPPNAQTTETSTRDLVRTETDTWREWDVGLRSLSYMALRVCMFFFQCPSALVRELDRFIIGQLDAKKGVAIALRNRWRRHRLPQEMRQDVTPKNLLLIGPTGCGKTEIARRLARLTSSPFVKVEATKYTEVGFHGRDVDSIIQDLVRVAIASTKAKHKAQAREAIHKKVSDKLLAALTSQDPSSETFRSSLENGELESIEVEVEVPVRSGVQEEDDDSSNRTGIAAAKMGRILDLLRSNRGPKTELRKLTIAEARPILEEAEMETILSTADATREAIQAVQEDGIVFIDEIDKIASTGLKHSADASAEGVQRDLLPLLEGTTVTTKQGDISTAHILFICSGAFHAVKPSDLLAELQGRLPIRVELQALTEEDLYRVLASTENSLVEQQTALLAVESIDLEWKDDALRAIAQVAAEMNRSVENIGARRLNTVIEKIVDEISYQAADDPKGTKYVIDAQFVRTKVADLLQTTDLNKFIL